MKTSLSSICSLTLATLVLSACGGGGGGGETSNPGTTPPGSTAGTLSVRVTQNGQAVTPAADVYVVNDPSLVSVSCNVACTVSTSAQDRVALTGTATTSDSWSSTVDFQSSAGGLDLRVAATDGSTLTVRLRTPTIAAGSASWSLDNLTWNRAQSTQSSVSAASTAMVVQSTSVANCRSNPFECGTVSVHWAGNGTGTFTLDPNFLTRSTPLPGTAWLNIKATGGTVNATIPNCTPIISVPTTDQYYNTDYRASSGQIRITRGADGLFRASTVTPITVSLQPDAENRSLCIRSIAAPQAPATMRLQLNNVF